MTDSHPNNMTVLRSVNRLLMTKTIGRRRKTGEVVKIPYGRESHFAVRQVELSGFDHLCKCLDTLTRQPHAFVIRGEALPTTNRENCRRLIYGDPTTGDPATFADAPRHWFAGDLDKVAHPVAIDPITDPDDAIEWLIGLLPPELQDASAWWQFTTSQSLPGGEGTLSCRLWFWNSTPVDCAALKCWGAAANAAAGYKLIDTALYTAVQPHYVTHPIFDGLADPLPRRCGVRRGLEEAVSLVIPEPDPVDPESYGSDGFVGIGVDGFLAQIGGEKGFRSPMVATVASYYASNGPDADPAPIKARLREAISAAPAGGRSAADIARY